MAFAGLQGDQTEVTAIVDTLEERRDAAASGLNAIEGVRCIVPNATFYLFPNVTEVMQRKGLTVYDEFRRKALHETGVSFCTRMHFGRAVPNESDQYVRFAYSGIDVADIEESSMTAASTTPARTYSSSSSSSTSTSPATSTSTWCWTTFQPTWVPRSPTGWPTPNGVAGTCTSPPPARPG